MKSWFGIYTSFASAEPVEVTVLATEKKITIGYRDADEKVVTLNWDLREIRADFNPALQATVIQSASAPGRLQIEGKEAANFIHESAAEQNKPWHQKDKTREWIRNGLIFSGVLAVLVAAYFLLVPWFSEKLASTVSVEREEQFGNTMYDALGLAAQEEKYSTTVLNEFFREMNIPTAYKIRISVVKGDVVNAFALPGGHIVVYTALLKQLKTYPELAALLSHEYIHVNSKHATKSIFRRLGSKVFLGLLLGKLGAVSSVLANQADELKSLNYSRSLEKEADMKGLAILNERKIDPEGFADLFKRLKSQAGADAMPELLASHPDIDTRISYIRSTSGKAVKEENPALRTIFDKLKFIQP